MSSETAVGSLNDKPKRGITRASTRNPASPPAQPSSPAPANPAAATSTPAAGDDAPKTRFPVRTPSGPRRHPTPIILASTLLEREIDLRPDYTERRRRDTATMISPTLADTIDDMQHVWTRAHREELRAAGLSVGHSTFRELLLRIGLRHLEDEAEALGLLPLDQRRRGGTGTTRH